MRSKPTQPQTTKLALFEIIEPLGRGASSFVFRARRRATNEPVAIKVLDISTNSKKCAAEREARFHLELTRSGFVKLIEEFDDEHSKYLVLEFCERGELYTYLKKAKCLSEKDAMAILEKLLDTMQSMHDRGIIHRDIKLGNIFLTGTGMPKMGDFGLMKKMEDDQKIERSQSSQKNSMNSSLELFFHNPGRIKGFETCKTDSSVSKSYLKKSDLSHVMKPKEGRYSSTGPLPRTLSIATARESVPVRRSSSRSNCKIVGTPNYLSPEIITRGQYGAESDIWALGCVFFALLHGRLPFEGSTIDETFEQIVSSKPSFSSLLSWKSKEILGSMFEEKPENRKSAKELLELLRSKAPCVPNMKKKKELGYLVSETLKPVRSKHELNKLFLKEKSSINGENSYIELERRDPSPGLKILKVKSGRVSISQTPMISSCKSKSDTLSRDSEGLGSFLMSFNSARVGAGKRLDLSRFGALERLDQQLKLAPQLRLRSKNDITAATSDEM